MRPRPSSQTARVGLALGAVLSLALAAGCRRAKAPSEKPAPAAATVNGVPIPVSRVQAELDRMRRESGEEGPTRADPKTPPPQLARAVLDALITRTLVLQRAKQANVQVSDAEVQRATEALAESVQRGGGTFGEHLARGGQTSEQLHEEMRERLIAEKYVAEQTRHELPSKNEVRAFYDTHRADWEQPEMAHVQAITVRSADEAKSLLDQLRKGASFDELARTNGITPDARNGGDLGWFPRGSMPKEFDAVAFTQPAGKLSGVLKTPYGYHVLKVLGRRPGRQRPFQDVRAEVERRAVADKQADAERQLLAQLRQAAEIHVDEAALAQVK